MLKIYRESTSSMHMLIQDSTLIDAAVAAGAKGIVYAGMGNGSIHKNAFSGLESAANKGVLVVRSSRTGSGLVVDSNSEWQNFINAGSLNPQKARVLLQLALKENFRSRRRSKKNFRNFTRILGRRTSF